MSSYILSGEHISKQYGKNLVLRDVSIHLKQGEIYGLIGKNGSGKTTLLRILSGLIPGYGGKVTIGNIDKPESRIAAVINAPGLFLNMTAFENMKEHTILLGLHDDMDIKHTLKIIGLEEKQIF